MIPITVTHRESGATKSFVHARVIDSDPGTTRFLYPMEAPLELRMRAAEIGDPLIGDETYAHDQYSIIVDGIYQGDGAPTVWRTLTPVVAARVKGHVIDLAFEAPDEQMWTVRMSIDRQSSPKQVIAQLIATAATIAREIGSS